MEENKKLQDLEIQKNRLSHLNEIDKKLKIYLKYTKDLESKRKAIELRDRLKKDKIKTRVKILNHKIKLNYKKIAFGFFILAIIFVIFYNGSKITGFVINEQSQRFKQNTSIVYTESNIHNLEIENEGIITSLQLNGKTRGNGEVKVYIANETSTFLVGILNSNFELNTQTIKKSNVSDDNSTLILSYKEGTIFDEDDNGFESINGAIDFSLSGTNFLKIENKVFCSMWEIYSIDEETSGYECLGDDLCCGYLGLIPSSETWDDTYYAFIGKNGATQNNFVRVKILSVDIITGNSYQSEWAELGANFIDDEKEFNDICLETCNFEIENKDLKLIFEINNATVNITSIDYKIIISDLNYTLNQTNVTPLENAILNITNETILNITNETIQHTNTTEQIIIINETILNYTENNNGGLIIIPPGKVASCGILAFDGESYWLENDIFLEQNSYCIKINSSIKFNCNNHKIFGNSSFSYGILISGTDTVEIINCNVNGFSTGILIENSENVNLSNTNSSYNMPYLNSGVGLALNNVRRSNFDGINLEHNVGSKTPEDNFSYPYNGNGLVVLYSDENEFKNLNLNYNSGWNSGVGSGLYSIESNNNYYYGINIKNNGVRINDLTSISSVTGYGIYDYHGKNNRYENILIEDVRSGFTRDYGKEAYGAYLEGNCTNASIKNLTIKEIIGSNGILNSDGGDAFGVFAKCDNALFEDMFIEEIFGGNTSFNESFSGLAMGFKIYGNNNTLKNLNSNKVSSGSGSAKLRGSVGFKLGDEYSKGWKISNISVSNLNPICYNNKCEMPKNIIVKINESSINNILVENSIGIGFEMDQGNSNLLEGIKIIKNRGERYILDCNLDFQCSGHQIIGLKLHSSNFNEIRNLVIENNIGGNAGQSNYSSGGMVYGLYLSESQNNKISDFEIVNNSGGNDLFVMGYGGESYGIYLVGENTIENLISNGIIENNIGGSGKKSAEAYGVYITKQGIRVPSQNKFENVKNEVNYFGIQPRFYSLGSLDITSNNNLGWWPILGENGNTTSNKAKTAYYGGESGGKNFDLSDAPLNRYWNN